MLKNKNKNFERLEEKNYLSKLGFFEKEARLERQYLWVFRETRNFWERASESEKEVEIMGGGAGSALMGLLFRAQFLGIFCKVVDSVPFRPERTEYLVRYANRYEITPYSTSGSILGRSGQFRPKLVIRPVHKQISFF